MMKNKIKCFIPGYKGTWNNVGKVAGTNVMIYTSKKYSFQLRMNQQKYDNYMRDGLIK